MNKYIETANFDVEKFPLDCGTLRGMQDNTAILAVLARIAAGQGTDRLILCGCEDMGNGYRGEGYIWKASEERPLTGEIIYHKEQRLCEKYLIEETADTVEVDGASYIALYRHREAKDSVLGTEYWSETPEVGGMSNASLSRQMEIETTARTEADDALRSQISMLSGVPKGIIMLWDLANGPIPQGWAPYRKMQGRMALGAKQDSGGQWDSGETGGSSTVSLKLENLPSHAHNTTVTMPAHSHAVWAKRKINVSDSGSGYDVAVVPGAGEGDEPRSKGGFECQASTEQQCYTSSSYAGGNKAVEIMPPYVKLVYIIKL